MRVEAVKGFHRADARRNDFTSVIEHEIAEDLAITLLHVCFFFAIKWCSAFVPLVHVVLVQDSCQRWMLETLFALCHTIQLCKQ